MKNLFFQSEVQKLSNTTVRVTRSFKAPRDLVFKAFTEPSLLKRWMLGPPGWEMPVCQIELKVGGKFLWRWKNKSNGAEFGFFGAYRVITIPEKIINTQSFDPGTIGGDMGKPCVATTKFLETSDFTTVETDIEYQDSADLEKALATGMTGGMEMSYQTLDKVLVSGENGNKE